MKRVITPVIDAEATGEKIKQYRIEKGYTIDEVCDALNVSVNAVYKWQRGETLPVIENFWALSILFDVPIEDLLCEM